MILKKCMKGHNKTFTRLRLLHLHLLLLLLMQGEFLEQEEEKAFLIGLLLGHKLIN